MNISKKRALLFIGSLIGTFVVLRISLYISPNTNLDILGYNIHHLFTGLVLIVFSGIPLVLFQQNNKIMDGAILVFAAGISMAIDEWVYLIATDGSDEAYWSSVSLWGGIIFIGLIVCFVLLLLSIKKINKI